MSQGKLKRLYGITAFRIDAPDNLKRRILPDFKAALIGEERAWSKR